MEPNDVLIVPPGKKTGCLPRRSRPGEICPLFGERIKVIPEGEWQGIIDNGMALRKHCFDRYDQDARGSCAAEGAHTALHTSRSFLGQKQISFNPWVGYAVTSGGRDGGSNIDDNLIYLRTVGAMPADIWPRYGEGAHHWLDRPDQDMLDAVASKYRIDEFFDISNVAEFGTALLLGMPVEFGWSGHAVCAVDLIDRNTFRYANSWDESWGDDGFGTLSIRSINWGYGAWAVRSATDAAEEL